MRTAHLLLRKLRHLHALRHPSSVSELARPFLCTGWQPPTAVYVQVRRGSTCRGGALLRCTPQLGLPCKPCYVNAARVCCACAALRVSIFEIAIFTAAVECLVLSFSLSPHPSLKLLF